MVLDSGKFFCLFVAVLDSGSKAHVFVIIFGCLSVLSSTCSETQGLD